MAIADGEKERVLAATDIVNLISERTGLKRSGSRWVGLCPFHNERTGSFYVNANEGRYYCFGCHQKGDAIEWVRQTQHFDFVDALRYLADKAGLTLQETESTGPTRNRKGYLEAMDTAVSWYHDQLLTSPDAAAARGYLRSRGYDGETVRRFQLGWAPDEWDKLATTFDLSADILDGTGLGFINARGRKQDFLRARIIFPIFDPSGKPIAVGGRILPPAPGHEPSGRPEPKYKNSPETVIYSKRKTLYGLNWAKDDVVRTGEIIVCEGYTDVIAFFNAGLPRAVATCGTALAEDHFRTMRNFASRIVLAYDGDFAGQNAAAAVYQWEKSHDVEVRVAKFPTGVDPAELAQRDPEALREAISSATPFLQFRVERALASASLDTAEGRARAAEGAVAMIAKHSSDLVRDQYLQVVADRCRLDVDRLRKMMSSPRPAATREFVEAPVPQGAIDLSQNRAAVNALLAMVNEPDLTDGRFVAAYFSVPEHRVVFESLASGELVRTAIDRLESIGETGAADLLERLVAYPEPPSDVTDEAIDEMADHLLRQACRSALGDIPRLVREQALAADEAAAIVADVQHYVGLLDSPQRLDATHALIEWLVGFDEAYRP